MSKIMFKNEKYIPAEVLSVGVDVGKSRHCAQAVAGAGEYLTRKAFYFENDRPGFHDFLKQVNVWAQASGCREICVGMEPTGPYWKCLANFLSERGFRTVLLSPYQVKKEKEAFDNGRHKTDPKDAGVIARMVSQGKFLKGAVLSDEQESLRHLVEYHHDLVTEKTACSNRCQSLLAEYFPEWEKVFSRLDGKTFIQIMKVCPTPDDIERLGLEGLSRLINATSFGRLGRGKAVELLEAAAKSVGGKKGASGFRYVIRSLSGQLLDLMRRIEEVELEIRTYLEEMEVYHYLKSIPGVGDVTIASVISAVGDFENYANVGCVLKQLGLQVFEISSGSKKGKRHISKRGTSLPRSKLYMSSLCMIKTDGIYHEKHITMKDRGKAGPVIQVALCCKLVRLMYALGTQKRMFVKDYVWGGAARNVAEQLRKAS